MVDCACDKAGVVVLVDNEKPVKEPLDPVEAAVLLTPNPEKELVVIAELPVAVVEAVVAAEELKLKEGTAGVVAAEEAAVAVVVVAGVEAVVVVIVENKDAEDVPNDKDVGFAAGVLEAVVAEEAALLKLKEG